MAATSLMDFYYKVMASPQLQDQLRGIADEASFVMKAVALGAAHGFRFTAEEVRAQLRKASPGGGELTDEQLAAVAGGAISMLRENQKY